MSRFRTAALAGAAATALLLVPSAAHAHDHGSSSTTSSNHNWGPPRLTSASSSSQVTDLQPTLDTPLDHATASVRMYSLFGSIFTLKLKGIDPSAAGMTYGAHLHTGPCVAGQPAAAGPHYNIDAINGVTPVEASDETEVWLDFKVDRDGNASSRTYVRFVPKPGDRAIIVHAEETAPDGTAGARLVCLPLKIR